MAVTPPGPGESVLPAVDLGSCAAAASALRRGALRMRAASGSTHLCVRFGPGVAALDGLAQALSVYAVEIGELRRQERALHDLAVDEPEAGGDEDLRARRLHVLRTKAGHAAAALRRETHAAREALEGRDGSGSGSGDQASSSRT